MAWKNLFRGFWWVIENNLVNVDEKFRDELLVRIERIKAGERDLYF